MIEQQQQQQQKEQLASKEIPVGGSLGILAYGYKGIMMWRQVRHDAVQRRDTKLSTTKQSNEEN